MTQQTTYGKQRVFFGVRANNVTIRGRVRRREGVPDTLAGSEVATLPRLGKNTSIHRVTLPTGHLRTVVGIELRPTQRPGDDTPRFWVTQAVRERFGRKLKDLRDPERLALMGHLRDLTPQIIELEDLG